MIGTSNVGYGPRLRAPKPTDNGFPAKAGYNDMGSLRPLGLASLLFSVPAVAQDGRLANPLTDIARCRTIKPDAKRLACFDAAAVSVSIAERSGDILVIDRKQVVADKRAGFGLPRTPTDVFGGGAADKATRVDQLDSTIRSAVPSNSFGRWNLRLADGSEWQTIDAIPVPPKTGTAIVVRQASLGGYRATIGKGRSVLVKRLR
ncbi:hypothetical protein [Sphingomonas albertensis]|uniref:Uncharacterized protein n=1 Tax=Sphingomonas albertensis TaxID=2762591 RepID=A0ABR7AQT2_9SPHN|nr:hypothetical protein [Sphingomonas albertensis]MBC3942826.1 hypothetical protein [Sphingomonas albertensis]